uniref:Uncharacterized protein n=1 Tax=Plectus sambesii TaxID=2011161 RepID=A0A914VZJ6_9BILA
MDDNNRRGQCELDSGRARASMGPPSGALASVFRRRRHLSAYLQLVISVAVYRHRQQNEPTYLRIWVTFFTGFYSSWHCPAYALRLSLM